MGERTGIAWCDHTFNPWWGCQRVSEGCRHCYAETLAGRFGLDVWGPNNPRRVAKETYWRQPVRWNRSASALAGVRPRVFCGSMCDVFEDHPDTWEPRRRLWRLIRETPRLDWLLLTKRPENIRRLLPSDWDDGPSDDAEGSYPNVWLGASIEDARVAHRADTLRAIPAFVRFISYEPALGPLDDLDLAGISWVIFGGESGPGHRPCNLDWARTMRAKCRDGGVAFFFKQAGGMRPGTGDTLDGAVVQEFPGVEGEDLECAFRFARALLHGKAVDG